jgi:hypothetical protein
MLSVKYHGRFWKFLILAGWTTAWVDLNTNTAIMVNHA